MDGRPRAFEEAHHGSVNAEIRRDLASDDGGPAVRASYHVMSGADDLLPRTISVYSSPAQAAESTSLDQGDVFVLRVFDPGDGSLPDAEAFSPDRFESREDFAKRLGTLVDWEVDPEGEVCEDVKGLDVPTSPLPVVWEDQAELRAIEEAEDECLRSFRRSFRGLREDCLRRLGGKGGPT